MSLDNIGFYTLSDNRAKNASATSPLARCELILTDKCNFKCPYCRGLGHDLTGTVSLESAKETVSLWAAQGLKAIRFSGGEPTVYPDLLDLVQFTREQGVPRIAISTNGSAPFRRYLELIDAGVNDISISLDACCASYGDKMAGVSGVWADVVNNIKALSKLTYVTLGIVVTEETIPQLRETIVFADGLRPADIRIISSAQFDQLLKAAAILPQEITDRYPILRYRIKNINTKRNVRGLTETDSHRCGLCLDDMAVAGGKHFPCIIYMREQGQAIGPMAPNARAERKAWFESHDTHKDPICKKNCLDVCIDYNNRFQHFQADKVGLSSINSAQFTHDLWRAASLKDLGVDSRYPAITSLRGRDLLKANAVGWCHGERLPVRPKLNHIAVMCHKDGEHFWFHIRTSEFVEVFS
jgi:molybdenum cofactor biosynthesis enzyme MoaA